MNRSTRVLGLLTRSQPRHEPGPHIKVGKLWYPIKTQDQAAVARQALKDAGYDYASIYIWTGRKWRMQGFTFASEPLSKEAAERYYDIPRKRERRPGQMR